MSGKVVVENGQHKVSLWVLIRGGAKQRESRAMPPCDGNHCNLLNEQRIRVRATGTSQAAAHRNAGKLRYVHTLPLDLRDVVLDRVDKQRLAVGLYPPHPSTVARRRFGFATLDDRRRESTKSLLPRLKLWIGVGGEVA